MYLTIYIASNKWKKKAKASSIFKILLNTKQQAKLVWRTYTLSSEDWSYFFYKYFERKFYWREKFLQCGHHITARLLYQYDKSQGKREKLTDSLCCAVYITRVARWRKTRRYIVCTCPELPFWREYLERGVLFREEYYLRKLRYKVRIGIKWQLLWESAMIFVYSAVILSQHKRCCDFANVLFLKFFNSLAHIQFMRNKTFCFYFWLLTNILKDTLLKTTFFVIQKNRIWPNYLKSWGKFWAKGFDF